MSPMPCRAGGTVYRARPVRAAWGALTPQPPPIAGVFEFSISPIDAITFLRNIVCTHRDWPGARAE